MFYLALQVATVAAIIGLTFKQFKGYKRWKNGFFILALVLMWVGLTPDRALASAPIQLFGPSRIAFYSCSGQINSIATFCDQTESSVGNDCFCKNKYALATIAHCYATAHEDQIPGFLKMCRGFNVSISESEFAYAAQAYQNFAKFPNEIMDFNQTMPVSVPIRLNDSVTLLYKDSYGAFLENYDNSSIYSSILISYWFLVVAIATISNWSKVLLPNFVQKNLNGRLSNSFRRYISLPATWGKKKTDEKKFGKYFDFLVPTRSETIIIGVFVCLMAIVIPYDIRYYENDIIFNSKQQAILRAYAVRTSAIASNLMPLLILFGGRNNFLQWLTRWDYSTYITFHRWISRIVVLLIVAHAILYSFYLKGNYVEEMLQPFLILGSLACIAGVAILIQGILILRRRWYEAFLVIHIILAAIFIGGAWFHVNEIAFVWFYYCSAVIWVSDRVVRISRIYSFGFPNAKVLLLSDECLKVVIPTPRDWISVPGGHVFIHFLRSGYFWQSHPFTYTNAIHSDNKIILYCKVKGGVTQTIYEELINTPQRSINMRVAVEGSYGEPTPASRYDSAIFIAGGNGIPGIFAEAYEMRMASNNLKQRVKLYWVIREFKSLYWFYEELLSLRDTGIEVICYVTAPDSERGAEDFEKRLLAAEECLNEGDNLLDVDVSEESVNVSEIISIVKTELNHIQFKEGRPNIEEIVALEIQESFGSTTFITCGHPVMVDEVRAAVVQNIGQKRADYFEQLQVWA
ncbi:ferric/cupric reductase transmembrane component 1 [[Candida] anglica]|uniref:Ferric/cupric reductase transmembrane component 1 n=1 Tax=[Candida] anglica TaxID=148631 RepID=A0ABP0ECF2_9ASCO